MHIKNLNIQPLIPVVPIALANFVFLAKSPSCPIDELAEVDCDYGDITIYYKLNGYYSIFPNFGNCFANMFYICYIK